VPGAILIIKVIENASSRIRHAAHVAILRTGHA
jgi:hypothetical protein